MAFSIIFFSIIGTINFFVSILRGVKKLEKVDKDKKAKIKETMIDEQNDDKESNK